MTDITRSMRTGDTGEPLTIRVKNKSDRKIADLTGASATLLVYLVNDDSTETVKVNNAACVVDSDAGEVTYEWQTGDIDVPGEYNVVFTVTYSGGVVESYPRGGNIRLLVSEV